MTVFHRDHIEPRSRFAEDDARAHDPQNLAGVCPMCNQHKSDKVDGTDPESGAACRPFNPRTDNWHGHFIALPNGRSEGLAAVGRATVMALKFNANPDRLFARAWWYAQGQWPVVD